MHAEQRCAEIHGEHLYKNAQDRSRQTLVSQPKSSMVISRKSSGHSSALPGCHCFSPCPQAAGPTASCSSRTHGHSLTLWYAIDFRTKYIVCHVKLSSAVTIHPLVDSDMF